MLMIKCYLSMLDLVILVKIFLSYIKFLKVLVKNWLGYLEIRVTFSGITLSGVFKTFTFWKKLDLCAFPFKKTHNSQVFLL